VDAGIPQANCGRAWRSSGLQITDPQLQLKRADAREFIEKSLVLKLDAKRGTARLDSYFDGNFWGNHNAAIDLEVQVPHGLSIFIDDGSRRMRIAGIDVENVEHDVEITGGGSG
jgi:hypothetical protein